MSFLWYPTPKESPLLGSLGLGGGIGSNLVSGGAIIPGTITGVYSSNSDGYSGGYSSTHTCNGISHSTFDARPPNQTQVNSILSTWMNCKSYSTDGVNPAASSPQGVFWGRSGNSLTITFSGFQANQDMATYLYTHGSRPINFSGLITGTETSILNDYKYFNVNSSGGGTLTYAFAAGGDPPYVYWVGPRYNDPGYLG